MHDNNLYLFNDKYINNDIKNIIPHKPHPIEAIPLSYDNYTTNSPSLSTNNKIPHGHERTPLQIPNLYEKFNFNNKYNDHESSQHPHPHPYTHIHPPTSISIATTPTYKKLNNFNDNFYGIDDSHMIQNHYNPTQNKSNQI